MRINKIDSVSNKIRTTIFIIFVTRLGNYIPVPNVDQEYLINILNSTPLLRNFYTSENLVLGIFSLGISTLYKCVNYDATFNKCST